MPANEPWRAIEFIYVFLMWAVMMIGMMAPSATPMILMYARVGRQAKRRASRSRRPAGSRPVISSPGAAFRLRHPSAMADRARSHAGIPDDARHNLLGACLLIAAGIYQWTSSRTSVSFNAARRFCS